MGLVQGVLLSVILPDLSKALMCFSYWVWYFTGTRYGLPFTGTSCYDISIIHIDEKKNTVADCLSCAREDDEPAEYTELKDIIEFPVHMKVQPDTPQQTERWSSKEINQHLSSTSPKSKTEIPTYWSSRRCYKVSRAQSRSQSIFPLDLRSPL
uniref:Uncharacterized protein n=1 Tax=Caenorhabditis japonica TaxID=281687 RepID=A0A8R1HJ70_CAEJA